MAPRKGITNNPNGRPKGTPNKATAEIRSAIQSIIGDQIENLSDRLEEMDDKTFVDTFIKLLPFVLPKLGEEVPPKNDKSSLLEMFKSVMEKGAQPGTMPLNS